MSIEKFPAADEFDRQLIAFCTVNNRVDISADELEKLKGFVAHLRRSGFNLVPAASPQPFAQGKP